MTVDINEAFKYQIIFDWVYLSDTHQITDQAPSGRTTSRANQHCLLTMLDKVCYNQEVVSVILLLDQFHFTLKAGLIYIIPMLYLLHVKELNKVMRTLPVNHPCLWQIELFNLFCYDSSIGNCFCATILSNPLISSQYILRINFNVEVVGIFIATLECACQQLIHFIIPSGRIVVCCYGNLYFFSWDIWIPLPPCNVW